MILIATVVAVIPASRCNRGLPDGLAAVTVAVTGSLSLILVPVTLLGS
jgi:hypothetical protein